MDLYRPCKVFKGKHAMLGPFHPAGRMLYIGHCNDENVFLAMTPDNFLIGQFVHSGLGYSLGSSIMSTCHYRQIVLMVVHFLIELLLLAFSIA